MVKAYQDNTISRKFHSSNMAHTHIYAKIDTIPHLTYAAISPNHSEVQMYAVTTKRTSNLHLHVREYIQLASYSQYKKLQDRNNPNPYIKIHPSSKSIHQGKNAKFSKEREIPIQVMIQMNPSNSYLYTY